MLKGLTWATLRANYSLIPLFSVVALGVVMAAGQSFRSLYGSPDVKVNRGNPDRPWEVQVKDDGTFKHTKYVRLHDYGKMKKSEYEPELSE
ncbi:unnamed protein product [Rotaria sp. Silwood2]|nr:unnamed protein product [Rotaria sp. Silwood2]CAF2809126.1 unnamed protein product [Rotaria sp. Silwood2]CAF3148669.1 unnamed protein product [Rotaria sp. Silwood2]CAF3275714.1 unnamed protein product [Rotaria sp. Silwood2]CAF4271163.1 unnamed protein product [Rotaria sp. Silwood2]